MWTDGDKSKTDLPYDLAWVPARNARVWDVSGDAALLIDREGTVVSKVDVTHTQ